MLDFPNSPSPGQTFVSSSNQQWTWDGTKWLPAGGAAAYWPPPMGDNRIINGDCRIDQRGVASGAGGTANGYTIDRWAAWSSAGGLFRWQRLTSTVSSFPYCLSATSLSAHAIVATDADFFQQPIEADMVSDFAWGTAQAQPVTLSFWAQSSLVGTFGGAIQNYANTRSYPFSFSLPTANTWAKIIVAIPGDTTGTWVMSGSGGAVSIFFDLGSGANTRAPAGVWANGNYTGATGAVSVVATNAATFYITGIKLEIGSVATPYNRQSLAKSLMDCQRYYSANFVDCNAYMVGANAFSTFNSFPATMRAVPTIAYSGIAYTNAATITAGIVQVTGTKTYAIASASGVAAFTGNMTASAEL